LPEKYGHFDHKRLEIVIHDNLTPEQARATFWHEFMHASLQTLSYSDLCADEEFVERLAQCLVQLEKTAVYDESD
jgi:hypothetical protein